MRIVKMSISYLSIYQIFTQMKYFKIKISNFMKIKFVLCMLVLFSFVWDFVPVCTKHGKPAVVRPPFGDHWFKPCFLNKRFIWFKPQFKTCFFFFFFKIRRFFCNPMVRSGHFFPINLYLLIYLYLLTNLVHKKSVDTDDRYRVQHLS